MELDDLVDQIAALPSDWHKAGTVQEGVLRALLRHARELGTITNSVETGTGKTTLLFSRLSHNHLVFTIDSGLSLTEVKKSSLFNPDTTRFVFGPTQRTMPTYTFTAKNQIVLIDGPHGYPFPDLEYFYLYPTIENGGLLLIDDIKIPTIRRMYDILRSGDMFELIEVVDDNMAFFRRTDVPLIDPEGDAWWLQAYNFPYARAFFPELQEPPHYRDQVWLDSAVNPVQYLLRWLSLHTPKEIKGMIPRGIKAMLSKKA